MCSYAMIDFRTTHQHYPQSVCAVPSVAVFCSSSLISWFPGLLVRYWLSDFEMVPVAPIITGITFVLTFHMRWISVLQKLQQLSTYVFLSCIITDYYVRFIAGDDSGGLHLLMAYYGYLTFMTCYYWFWCTLIAVFFVWLYPYFLAHVKVYRTHTLSCLFVYSSFASIDCADIMCSVVLSCFRFVMCLLHDVWCVMPVISPHSHPRRSCTPFRVMTSP